MSFADWLLDVERLLGRRVTIHWKYKLRDDWFDCGYLPQEALTMLALQPFQP